MYHNAYQLNRLIYRWIVAHILLGNLVNRLR